MSVDALRAELIKLAEENNLLKQQLAEKDAIIAGLQVPTPTAAPLPPSPEEIVLESQLAILRSRAEYEELTLEDVKKLDILIKNKNLASQKRVVKDVECGVQSPLTTKQLIAIAKIK